MLEPIGAPATTVTTATAALSRIKATVNMDVTKAAPMLTVSVPMVEQETSSGVRVTTATAVTTPPLVTVALPTWVTVNMAVTCTAAAPIASARATEPTTNNTVQVTTATVVI